MSLSDAIPRLQIQEVPMSPTMHSIQFSGSTRASEAAEVFLSSIKGKVILITGVNQGGLGGATAKALAPHQPRLLILAGRSPAKVDAVIQDVRQSNPLLECRFLAIDLSSQSSIRRAAAIVLEYAEPLHLLINNAAVMNISKRTISEDGVEMQFATNHVGPFLLTNLLMPKLISTASSSSPRSVRIINLSSSAHTFSPVRFTDLNFEKPNDSLPESERYQSTTLANLGLLVHDGNYVPTAAYAQSKTADILFTIALNTRLAAKYGIVSVAVHPGSIDSELQRHADPEVLAEARKTEGFNVVRKTLEQGASTTLVAALDPKLEVTEDCVYMKDCAFGLPADWCSGERGLASAERLWGVSQELVREAFDW